MLSRRAFLAGGVAAAAGAGFLGYAVGVEPEWLEVVRRTMPIAGLPDALVGGTLLQLSDLHIGHEVRPEYVRDTLRRAAALRPDVVVFTGDFVTYGADPRLGGLERALRDFPHGRLGTFGVLGNHDYGHGWRETGVADRVAAIAADAGITMLRNEAREVAGVQFAGLGDFWTSDYRPREVLPTLRPDAPTVVLCHNPDVLDEPVWGDIRGWVLSGHTHGGQCRPPFLPPPVLPVRNRRYTAGTFAVGDRRTLYINRGVGYILRVRVNVRPEITLFTLARG